MSMWKNSLISCVFILLLSACAAVAKIVDSMDNPWNLSYPGGNHNVTITEGANKINFDFEGSDWVQIYRNDFDEISLSSSDSISFYFKGFGEDNNLKLQIYDKDGDVFERPFTNYLKFKTWQKCTATFNSFSHWQGTGDGKLNNITKIVFSITPQNDNNGALSIDETELTKLNNSNSFLISSFNYGVPPNEAGGNEGTMSPSGDYDPTISYLTDSYEGQYSLSLGYDFPGWAWCGYWIFLSSGNENGVFDVSSYNYLNFFTKADSTGKKYKIEIVDSSDTKQKIQITDYLSEVTTYFQELKIPTTAFASVDLSSIKQVNIIFDQSPTTGTVYIDWLRFTSGVDSGETTISKIDTMDDAYKVSGWTDYGISEEAADTSLDTVSGQNGNAIKMSYAFLRSEPEQNDWVALERDWGINLATFTALCFKYKGNKSCDLEVKMEDKDGTTFQRKFYDFTDTNSEWKTITIPFDEFSPVQSGSDSDFALTKLKGIYITLIKREDDEGEFFVDDIEVVNPSTIEESKNTSIIKSLQIDNNPFSPNGDGLKDVAKFTYEFSEKAKAKIEIYTLNGEKIFQTMENAQKSKGTLQWDGTGEDAKNGIYFFKFIAETSDGEDSVVRVIGVLR